MTAAYVFWIVVKIFGLAGMAGMIVFGLFVAFAGGREQIDYCARCHGSGVEPERVNGEVV